MLTPEKTFPDNPTRLLNYVKPFNFKQILSFLEPRTMVGVEVVTEESYSRTFRTDNTDGFFTVADNPEESALELQIGCDNKACRLEIINRVRRMFDLDTDSRIIDEKFGKDKLLSKGMVNGNVPRLPIAFDPFEFVVRAILGQQISVKAATTFAARIAKRAALKSDDRFPSGLDYFFPNPSELLHLDLDGLGLTKTRQTTIKTVTRGILDEKVKLSSDQQFDTFHKEFSALKGIGDWTVNYVAMRGLGMVDSFPATDLGVIKALSKKNKPLSTKEITNIAENWRPYRSYATLCLWNL
jgi:AraC family transcriptional regulator, regulatory protein of adaptative response / DNA-3-methyladenine glycosylase II